MATGRYKSAPSAVPLRVYGEAASDRGQRGCMQNWLRRSTAPLIWKAVACKFLQAKQFMRYRRIYIGIFPVAINGPYKRFILLLLFGSYWKLEMSIVLRKVNCAARCRGSDMHCDFIARKIFWLISFRAVTSLIFLVKRLFLNIHIHKFQEWTMSLNNYNKFRGQE